MTFSRDDFFEVREDIRIKKNKTIKFSIEDQSYRTIIIPNYAGQFLLANFYKEKYGIDIFILSSEENLQFFIDYFSRQARDLSVGFVIAVKEENLVHACPVVYTRQGTKEGIIIFDSVGVAYSSLQVASSLTSFQLKTIPIYINYKTRQEDWVSCFNDAFVILKEVLRCSDILTHVNSRSFAITKQDDFKAILFWLPEIWCKSVQRDSYLSADQANSNLGTIVHYKKNEKGERQPESLQQFRDRYMHRLNIKYHPAEGKEGENKSFNTEICENIYLKLKGYSNIARVQQQYEKHQKNLKSIYNVRSGADILKLMNVSKMNAIPVPRVSEDKFTHSESGLSNQMVTAIKVGATTLTTIGLFCVFAKRNAEVINRMSSYLFRR